MAEADEDDCALCGGMSPTQRPGFRASLVTLPLGDEAICEACLMAFARNLGWLGGEGKSTKH